MQTEVGSVISWDRHLGYGGVKQRCLEAVGTGVVIEISITDYSDPDPPKLDSGQANYRVYYIPVILEHHNPWERFDLPQYDSEGCPDPIMQWRSRFTGRTVTGIPIEIVETDRYRSMPTTVWMFVTDREAALDRATFMAELGAVSYQERRRQEKEVAV